MTKETAIRFSNSGWYRDRSPEEITALQLYEDKMCVPAFDIFHSAIENVLGRPVQTFEFGLCMAALKKEFLFALPNANELIRQMELLKRQFICEDFARTIDQIEAENDVYISPAFQCNQTGGVSTSLCVCWEKGMAWLVLTPSLIKESQDISEYEYLCADFGFHSCSDTNDFNRLLRILGKDAYAAVEHKGL